MMRTTMPREEATVMVSQSVFGALLADSLNEALRAIYNNDNNQWYLNRMVHQMKIFSDGVNYQAIPRSKHDSRITKCFWVLMKYIDTVDLPIMQKGRNPDGVSVLRNNKLYRVVVAKPETDITFSLINRIECIKQNKSTGKNHHGVRKRSSGIPGKNHAFAVVSPYANGEIPEVSFYTKKAVGVQIYDWIQQEQYKRYPSKQKDCRENPCSPYMAA